VRAIFLFYTFLLSFRKASFPKFFRFSLKKIYGIWFFPWNRRLCPWDNLPFTFLSKLFNIICNRLNFFSFVHYKERLFCSWFRFLSVVVRNAQKSFFGAIGFYFCRFVFLLYVDPTYLQLRVSVGPGTVLAFYNGIRIPPEVCTRIIIK
jgi:hypothetical protein